MEHECDLIRDEQDRIILNVTRMNSFIVQEKHKYIQDNLNYKLNGLGGNTHEMVLNA